ncbi:hypothetical protein [Streptomyces sp. SID13031]|uniref:hypothetical protein n=1 Tax=Streptomyces sp. SID13031 TaxID=2706046 RepID=UPI0013C63BDA|nr:hypothetical protein [Streptomyces sp. SID13031]NEA31538.1 hypothetical protein [Streptomyces sp. SID13031]
MKKLVVTGVMMVALVVPLGCSGGSDDGGLPTLGGDSNSTEAPTSAPTEAPTTPITTGPTSPPAGLPSKTVAVHRRKVTATTAEQKAAADAFLNYLLVRLTAYNKASVDVDALGRVASGKALTEVTSYVTELKSRKHHAIGEIWVDISSIAVKGSTATLKSCMDNTSLDADAAGKPVEDLVPYLSATGTLQKAGGTVWVVSNISFVEQRCK